MKQTFHFYAGMPRSGGTVLSSILNQNPDVYVASSTAMYEVLEAVNKTWYETPTMVSHPIPEQLTNLNRAIIDSMWMHRKEPIIIDRNREWAHSLSASSQWFEKDIKVIASIRDIPGIMASWVTLFKRERPIETEDDVEELTNNMWNVVTKQYVDSFVKMKNESVDRVLFFEYDDIVSNPRYHLSQIEKFLGLPHFYYDLENIHGDYQDSNIVPEGVAGLHRIRPKYEKVSVSPDKELGTRLYRKYQKLDNEFRTNLGLPIKYVPESQETIFIR